MISKFALIDFLESLFKKYKMPYSPYQFVLFIGDLLACCVSYCVIISLMGVHNYFYSESDFYSGFLLVLLLLTFFPVYSLYSYHVIFRFNTHFIKLLKAYFWSCFSLMFIFFVYNYHHYFFVHYSSLMMSFVAFFALAILGKIFSIYFGQFILAIGIALLFVGLFGLIESSHPPYLILNTQVLSVVLIFCACSVICVRLFLVHIVYNVWLKRYFRRQVIIVGNHHYNADLINYIIAYNAPYWVTGIVFVTLEELKRFGSKISSISSFYNKKILGHLDDLPKLIKEHKINELIITSKEIAKRRLIELLDFAVSNGLVAWFPPDLLPIIPMKLKIDSFCGLPMIRMGLQRNPEFFKAIKRMFDIFFASLLIILFSPLFIFIAVAIKLDSKGPIFYRAEMVGENGKHFKMLKFRSMRVDADSKIHKDFVSKFIKGEIDRKKSSVLKITDDPRVTRVGKIIRRLSLDELPQLFNVLKGDMSLVGPRPCLPYEYELYKDWHRKRNSVKPGITGLWQITGRSEVSFEEMILLDLYYIYNRNLLLDISILFETIFVVLGMKGAY